jgi:formylglycine-generating enzyme required for sulfatase activity
VSKPAHEVTLTKGYWIDKDEVTNAASLRSSDAGGYTNQASGRPKGWSWLGGKKAASLPLHCQGDVAEASRGCA